MLCNSDLVHCRRRALTGNDRAKLAQVQDIDTPLLRRSLDDLNDMQGKIRKRQWSAGVVQGPGYWYTPAPPQPWWFKWYARQNQEKTMKCRGGPRTKILIHPCTATAFPVWIIYELEENFVCNAPRACTKTGLPTRQSSSRREASLKSSKGVNVWIRQQHYLYLSWFPSRVKDKSKPEQGAIEGVHCAFITNVVNLDSSWKEKGLPECKGACLFSSVQAVNWGGVPGYWIRSLLTWIRSLLTWIRSLLT